MIFKMQKLLLKGKILNQHTLFFNQINTFKLHFKIKIDLKMIPLCNGWKYKQKATVQVSFHFINLCVYIYTHTCYNFNIFKSLMLNMVVVAVSACGATCMHHERSGGELQKLHQPCMHCLHYLCMHAIFFIRGSCSSL